RAALERDAPHVGGRTHHADVRAVGLLRRGDALRVLPAPGEGARSVAPPLADARIRPHRRFARRGWIEVDIEGPDDVERALRWLRCAHATVTRGVHADVEGET